MTNADNLTTDAQSALRRCIELFNHTTRFIIILEDRHRLLKPIISRFCEIYVPLPIINNKEVNLHTYTLNNFLNTTTFDQNRLRMLKNKFDKNDNTNVYTLITLVNSLYEKGYSGLDIMTHIKLSKSITNICKYKLLLLFEKAKTEFRSEKFFMFLFYILLYYVLMLI